MKCFAIGMLYQARNLTDRFELNFKEFDRNAIDTSTPEFFLALTEFPFKLFHKNNNIFLLKLFFNTSITRYIGKSLCLLHNG